MEDTHYVSSCKRFSAVFDGHGGAAVAQYLQQNLYSTLAPTLAQLDQVEPEEGNHTTSRSALEDMLRQAVDRVDADVIARSEWKYQGSTAVGVLLHGDAIFSFNVGDSRAVMSRGGQVVELTRDHKPNDPIELTRIQKLGGSVKWHGYVDAQGEPIEPYGAYRINGNLAVARAIGDRDLRPYVSGEVEIKQFDRDFTKDEFIVIASDGLWDVFTSDEAVTFVHDVLNGEVGGRESWRSGAHGETRVSIFEWSHQYKSDRGMIKAARLRRKTQIANYLVQEALFRGTSDNVSVVVVWLK
ncbi:hypothetical protein Poli38472_008724 [Pythium oligandrum]|uniref:PPM-type phosphatase domain-containing protein n=1 Tax=Pythium oligandrum TaxID=41045 RepID=A0A8K1C3Y4_PYTOL|nr:hypothetical protein Poli38472_008724 [Pythium oligandrum]|eukprot:TMW56076.1 hypothetical protein Poli38472_008724 [Pythium oligandrum]